MYDPKKNSLGLLFFIPNISLNIKGFFSLIVIINGIFCHGSYFINYKHKKKITNFDILCNIFMGIFILYTENINISIILISEFIGFSSFIINKYYFNSSPLLHIFGVQLPLSVGLYNYSYNLKTLNYLNLVVY